MPLAPRLAMTRMSARGGAYHSTSRMGIDEATTRPASARERTRPGPGPRPARSAPGGRPAPADGLLGRPLGPGPQPGPGRRAPGPGRAAARAAHSSAGSAATTRGGRTVGVEPGAVGLHRHLRRPPTRPATAPGPATPEGRRDGARPRGVPRRANGPWRSRESKAATVAGRRHAGRRAGIGQDRPSETVGQAVDGGRIAGPGARDDHPGPARQPPASSSDAGRRDAGAEPAPGARPGHRGARGEAGPGRPTSGSRKARLRWTGPGRPPPRRALRPRPATASERQLWAVAASGTPGSARHRTAPPVEVGLLDGLGGTDAVGLGRPVGGDDQQGDARRGGPRSPRGAVRRRRSRWS